MKSHLIPEPTPIDRNFRETDAAHFYMLDQELASGKSKMGGKEELRPAPEMTMRNFLRVVFVR
jgi:hypothetical protein